MPELESLIEKLIESGRDQAVAGVPDGLEAGLATLQFADQLRRAADRLCQEAAASGTTIRRQLAADRGSRRGNHATRRGAPVQSCRQGATLESIQGCLGGQRTPLCRPLD